MGARSRWVAGFVVCSTLALGCEPSDTADTDEVVDCVDVTISPPMLRIEGSGSGSLTVDVGSPEGSLEISAAFVEASFMTEPVDDDLLGAHVVTVACPGVGTGVVEVIRSAGPRGAPGESCAVVADIECAAGGEDGGVANTATDPEDLTGPDGDPSLDVTSVELATDAGGAPWVRVVVVGNWPPSDSLYSWFLQLALYQDGSTDPVAEITRQRHDGTDETFVTGLDMSDVTVTDETSGLLFVFDPGALAEPPDSFSVTSGVQRTSSGNRVTDEVARQPFGDATASP